VQDGNCSHCGQATTVGRTEKMSKSKKNVVDPDGLIRYFGADTARLFSLFAAPPEKDLEWNEQGVEGCFRFLNRVWRLLYENIDLIAGDRRIEPLEGSARDLRRQVHRTIKKVTDDIDGRFHFNTAISAVMELVNGIAAFKEKQNYPAVVREALETVVRLLNPFVPHITAELWQLLGHTETLEERGWPNYDESALVEEEKLIVVQVNGKVRGKISVSATADEETVRQLALNEQNVARFLEGKAVRKVVVVPGRLVSVVVG
jgi:leucyl-tRNA synthetase